MRILGLDLGIASIGWACIDETNGEPALKGWGSRIFEPGMDDDIASGKGVSRCSLRRLHRSLRIQYRRRRARKNALIELLQEKGLLPDPLTDQFYAEMDGRFLKTLPDKDRITKAQVIPYLYRVKALDEPLQPYEMGRVLMHLAQRRGYLSNRKQEIKDADSGVVKEGIDRLKQAIADGGCRTLGEYFSTVEPEKFRIRTRYTERAMYQDEFHKICQAQRALISEELEKQIYWTIFFQRPLKSCKGLIGKCQKYPDKKRCSYAREEAQLFRIYTNINHLRVTCKGTVRSLTDSERTRAFEVLNGYSPLISRRGTVALGKLAAEIPLAKGEKFRLCSPVVC